MWVCLWANLSKDLEEFVCIWCNVPILGHYNITECYAYWSSQIGVTESSGDIEGFYWARLASFIIRIHSAQLGFGSVAFRRFL
jgi:hypothetical protein